MRTSASSLRSFSPPTMDSRAETQPPLYSYQTLSPLSFDTTAQSPEQPSPETPLETYTVFRHEISSSAKNIVPEKIPTQDYFSLDLEDPSEELDPITGLIKEEEPRTPVTENVKKKKEAVIEEREPTLESGWFNGNNRFKSPMLQLHKEIVDFCDFLSPTPEEEASRREAVESVFEVIKYIWPNCQIEVFGSFRTGLFLPTSDIDVVILQSGLAKPQRGLQAIARALAQKGLAKEIQVIAKARVPIIKFIEKKSGISFDISFDAENGPKAAEFIKDAIRKWPQLRPLCLILKVFLQQRDLNEVYSGGIGSYALLLMLMAMLKNLQESRSSSEDNLGCLLVNFFDFYGRKLNTVDVGVSCRGEGTFYLKSNKGFLNKSRSFLISIEDPQTPENDVGKNSWNYFQIRSAFAMAFMTLTNAKSILQLPSKRSILGTIIRPDAVLLKRKGGLNGDTIVTKLLNGAGQPLQTEYDGQQELMGNWRLDDEEPLPRGGNTSADPSSESLGKKRKSHTKSRKSSKKLKENINTENDSKKKKRSSKNPAEFVY